ncbi:MAG TPA: twin-arginine translocase TatA/TatE family subunit [Croceibacterium sp.]|nr:twin-arginine translocase TatA/TatE family subunit [Croceibacterium sp.]
MKPGLFQILIIAMLILVFFGRGKISEMMGDFGKGIKSFKRGLDEGDAPAAAARLEGPGPAAQPVTEAAADARPAAD